MAFQQDSSVDVRKFVVSFIEDAWYSYTIIVIVIIIIIVYYYWYSKKDSHLLSRAIPMLQYILKDNNNIILKRVIVCFMQLYKIALSVCYSINYYYYY